MFSFNKFVFSRKIDLDPSLIEPPLLLSYLNVPFFVFICRCVLFFFLFHQGPIQTSLRTGDAFRVVASLPPKNSVCEPERQNDFRDVKPFVLMLASRIKE